MRTFTFHKDMDTTTTTTTSNKNKNQNKNDNDNDDNHNHNNNFNFDRLIAPPALDSSEMRGCLGHVVLLQVAFQRRQLPCTTPSNDVLLCQTRGENTYHDLGRVIGGKIF